MARAAGGFTEGVASAVDTEIKRPPGYIPSGGIIPTSCRRPLVTHCQQQRQNATVDHSRALERLQVEKVSLAVGKTFALRRFALAPYGGVYIWKRRSAGLVTAHAQPVDSQLTTSCTQADNSPANATAFPHAHTSLQCVTSSVIIFSPQGGKAKSVSHPAVDNGGRLMLLTALHSWRPDDGKLPHHCALRPKQSRRAKIPRRQSRASVAFVYFYCWHENSIIDIQSIA